MRNADHGVKEKGRKTFAVPAASGDYAAERITFGAVGSGEAGQSFMGVTLLIEGDATACPAGASAELWLKQVGDGAVAASAMTDDNYFFAGRAVFPARGAASSAGVTVSFGHETWPLSGWPGAQIRVRSGGVPGSMTVSATAF